MERGRHSCTVTRAGLVDLNLKYPQSPKGFTEWKKKIDAEIGETKKRFIPAGAAA